MIGKILNSSSEGADNFKNVQYIKIVIVVWNIIVAEWNVRMVV